MVGDRLLMGSDGLPEHLEVPQGSCVSLEADRLEEAECLISDMAQGGPIQDALATNVLGGAFWHGRRLLQNAMDRALRWSQGIVRRVEVVCRNSAIAVALHRFFRFA